MNPDTRNWPWLLKSGLTPINHISDERYPKISIITPSYNQGQYLEETIHSVILQNYPNYELLIIDAGSTDTTLDVIRKYEPWITHWVSEPDRGQSHAIQKGLALATGDIINWINSDDLVAPGAFHRIATEFNLEKYDVICGKCDYFLDSLDQLDLRDMRMGLGPTVGDTLAWPKINQPSTFFKAAVLKELGIDERFRYTMDVDLWYRYLLRAGQSRVLLSEGLLTYFRLHGASKSVAESAGFEGEVWVVYYNVLYSTHQAAVLLDFARQAIPVILPFSPTRYEVRVAPAELRAFVRHVAWLGLHHYNEQGNYAAARQCLTIARRHGQPLDATVLRQLVKHYLLPKSLVRWFATRSSNPAS
ncbi:glycosyltransferase family 2 protein [Hymenobacter volaticus]|uniref:Glycosyltransferase n=1 Tax=Hymenobacter volaticus TaxID=2932254 RepID=A0ABY4G8Z3_9BACT|nr:glycosyltransferase family 2 protein [Hymenobacter volaticus]UOQ67216.1 glycosyltransferase [Hymenobacter volaticus]